MISNLARVAVVLAILLLAFLNPAWSLFLITGLTIRVAWSNRHTEVVKGILNSVTGLILVVISFVTGIYVLWLFLLVVAFLLNSCASRSGPTYESVEYKTHIEFNPTSNTFLVNDEVIIASEARINMTLSPPGMRSSVVERAALDFDGLMTSEGWAYAGTVNGKPKYSRRREQEALCSWFSSYTVNDISIPQVSHENIVLVPDEQSKIFLDVPKHLILSTFPSSTPQSLLKGGRELFEINMTSSVRAHPNLEVGVVHPALRTEVGISLIKTSIWTPVYWAVAALLLIFSKQIELGILMPCVRRLFKILGLNYLKENGTAEASETSAKGETRTGRAKLKGKLSRRFKG